jgi:hypothetical protein
VEIQPLPDGRTAVLLPSELTEVFVQDLQQRAQEWQEALRRARIQEIEHNAQLQVATGEARRKMELRENAWTEEYLRLRNQKKGHREALNIIRGPKERDAVLVTDVELGIQNALGRSRRRHREARNAEIVRLAGEGLSRQAISDTLRISYCSVHQVLNRAGIRVQDARHDRRGAVGPVR